MRHIVTALSLLLTPVIFAQQPSIRLKPATASQPHLLGHAHVFADKQQTLHLCSIPPLKKNLRATLYRAAGKILTPSGDPISIPPTLKPDTPVTIDFPRSEKQLHYTLVLNTRPKTRLNITVHPTNLLKPVRQYTKTSPLQLFNAPDQLPNTLHQLRIHSSVLTDLNRVSKGALIVFAHNKPKLSNLRASRIIVIDPTLASNREIWVSTQPGQWRITLPSHYLDPKRLHTAKGQADLKRILLTTPR